MNPKLNLLVEKLVARTEQGRVRWTAMDANAYRTEIGSGQFRITRTEKLIPGPEGDPMYADCLWATVTNGHAQVIAEESAVEYHEGGYALLDRLFNQARLAATDGGAVLDDMLTALDRP